MKGLHLEKAGNDVFIPFSAIDRLRVSPEKDFVDVNTKWYSCPKHEWVETGKWNLVIETIGGKEGRLRFDTKELAQAKLEEIKKTESVDIIINKITVKE
jgi:hypothetical protein